MKPLRLRAQHEALCARFEEVAGYEVPATYGDALKETLAVRQAVGVTDLEPRGKYRVTGDDRVTWLQSLISNDLLSLRPGQGLYSSLLSHKGKMLTYFRAYLQPDAVLLEDVGEIGDATFQHLRKFLLFGTNAKMEALRETWGHLLVSGPHAPDLLRQSLGLEVGRTDPLAHGCVEHAGHPLIWLRTEETGELDVELLVPAQALEPLWVQLWAHGRTWSLKPFGWQAREILRLEAGLPRAGRDLTEEIVPPEANLEGKAFSLTKGCYPGQEVVARMDTYGSVRRRLVGLALKDAPVPRPGARLYSAEREVGWVSSAVRSPRLGQTIALGFPLRDFTSPGTVLAVETDGRRYEATVQPLPFPAS